MSSKAIHDFAGALEKAAAEALANGIEYKDFYHVLGSFVGYALGNDVRNTPQAIETGLATFFDIAHRAAADRYANRLASAAGSVQ